MKTMHLLAGATSLLVSVLASGCHNEPAVASPACVELEKTTDPVRRQELERKCPRGGPAFKPSPVVNW